MAQWVEKLGIGGMQSVKVVLQNPLDKSDVIDYIIVPNDTLLSRDWIAALKDSYSDDKEESKPELPEFDKVCEFIDSESKDRSEEIERNREVNLKKLKKFKKEMHK